MVESLEIKRGDDGGVGQSAEQPLHASGYSRDRPRAGATGVASGNAKKAERSGQPTSWSRVLPPISARRNALSDRGYTKG